MIESRRADVEDLACAVPLVAKFRAELRRFNRIEAAEDSAAAREEFLEYLDKGYPVYLALDGETPVGYLACRVDAPCVWVESLYVLPSYRRRGVASLLYDKAEALARSYGEDTLYNYVHPNNGAMIALLASRGYDVLNLIEIRKPCPGETLETCISVGEHSFKY
ncbi:MAG: Acetyltransferase (GNAT) family protein [Firmicutes bacterium ADurb.Bin248]|nr:MAG: Acetyltransferase (GNAT) family protein [Firmicutes bacterium ADurb.Bin248]HOG01050.1 GNAT family N-acetyltransferase [Clostridia bacterium]HPK15533.1 GNAT family N-acetyltransferase [Clostridia bacterium]